MKKLLYYNIIVFIALYYSLQVPTTVRTPIMLIIALILLCALMIATDLAWLWADNHK